MPPHESPSGSPDDKVRRRPALGADLVCFSHLRWDFVFQRPQHLMTRFANSRRVFFVEEPRRDAGAARLEVRREAGVTIAVPFLPATTLENRADTLAGLQGLVDGLLADENIQAFVTWYYTPMALPFTAHLAPRAIVYDCMDDLSRFQGAPPDMTINEAALLARADLVLTGGRSLYDAKRGLHRRVLCFPSSVDVAHFATARTPLPEPADQQIIPRPRLGYAGVIDERIDVGLIAGVAAARPDWQIVLLGPVVKIDPATLPRASNIHYLGMKSYDQLPRYMASWDVALLPFARNEATRFISPTKTPEYLAAGRPVVSTSITDVVRPYGVERLARIADSVPGWIEAIGESLAMDLREHRARADRLLAQDSWDYTARRMTMLLDAVSAGPILGSGAAVPA